MQLAFVPEDIEQALGGWTAMGAGPFFHLPHVALLQTRYRGVPTAPDFSMWLGYWGDMQVELIQQHNEAPSIYRNARDNQRLHHMCILVDDFAASMKAAAGMERMQEALVPGGGEVAYVQPPQGPMIEILQPAPGMAELFQMMRAAHTGWDGRDPVRSL